MLIIGGRAGWLVIRSGTINLEFADAFAPQPPTAQGDAGRPADFRAS